MVLILFSQPFVDKFYINYKKIFKWKGCFPFFIKKGDTMDNIKEYEDFLLAYSFLARGNMIISDVLSERGVKLRKHKWTEFEAG